MSAVRSAASSAQAGPSRQRDFGRHLLPPLPLDDEFVDVLHPALPHRLLDHIEPEDNARPLLHDPSPSPRPLGHSRFRSDIPSSDILGKGPSHDVSDQLVHRRSLEGRVPL